MKSTKKMKKTVDYKTVLLISQIAKVLKPPPKYQISDWADANRMLSPESSASAGHWDTSTAEFQREIMNAVSDPVCEKLAIKSSSQVGKTEILLNILGYYVDYEPSPILLLQPTTDMAEAVSKDRIAPMIRDTPILRRKIRPVRSRDSENTISHKKFPGGHLTLIGSNSPASLASRPIRILLADEIDRYPDSAGKEGDPLKLAEKRTITFWNRKIIMVSTPTDETTSKIEKAWKNGSMEEWSVECPCCHKYQPYEFKRLSFKTMKMKCSFCKEEFSEMEWKQQPHKWVAERPERKSFRSFHLNEMAVSWVRWESMVQEYQEAKEEQETNGSIEKLKVFINTALGEVWREAKNNTNSYKKLLKRREVYEAELPDEVLLITAAVDVQDDRLEIERCGWARNFESWGLQKEILFQNPAFDETWEKLEEILNAPLHFKNGHTLNVAATCVDTGGNHTNAVYKFIKKMEQKRKNIFGIKGYSDAAGIPLVYKKSKVVIKNKDGIPIDETHIYILGVDAGKEDIMNRLEIEKPGGGYCHFPIEERRGYDEAYMKGLLSEVKVTKKVRGKWKSGWVQLVARNEPLDLRVYNLAAHEILRPNYDILEQKIKRGINYMEKPSKKKKKRGCVNKGVEV